MTHHKAPKHIKADTAKWFLQVLSEYDLEPHHIRLLTLACEAWDGCEQARKVLSKEGQTYLDRFGAPRARPEVAIERDNRLAFTRLVRELDLDVETVSAPSRPPGLKSNRR